MADFCSEKGCDGKVFSRGLCSKHYQRARRSGFKNTAKPGRPRSYEKGKADPHGGAPKMTVRFAPEILDWVKEQGGATWVRHAARELKRLCDDPEFSCWWNQLSLNEQDPES